MVLREGIIQDVIEVKYLSATVNNYGALVSEARQTKYLAVPVIMYGEKGIPELKLRRVYTKQL